MILGHTDYSSDYCKHGKHKECKTLVMTCTVCNVDCVCFCHSEQFRRQLRYGSKTVDNEESEEN